MLWFACETSLASGDWHDADDQRKLQSTTFLPDLINEQFVFKIEDFICPIVIKKSRSIVTISWIIPSCKTILCLYVIVPTKNFYCLQIKMTLAALILLFDDDLKSLNRKQHQFVITHKHFFYMEMCLSFKDTQARSQKCRWGVFRGVGRGAHSARKFCIFLEKIT